MGQLGVFNREAYLRKMALDGYAVKLDLPDLKELLSLVRRISNNLNQLVRRVNSTGRVYQEDLADLSRCREEIWEKEALKMTALFSIFKLLLKIAAASEHPYTGEC